jgi:hypothetical protein
MISNVPQKIDCQDIGTDTEISALRTRLLPDLQALGVSVESPEQIAFIYGGRMLRSDDTVASIIIPGIEPPYTVQIHIRRKGAPPPQEKTRDVVSPMTRCCLIL